MDNQKSGKKGLIIGIIVVIVLIIIGIAIAASRNNSSSSYQDNDGNEMTMPATSTPSDTTASSSVDVSGSVSTSDTGEKVVTIQGGNFYFTPATITVNKGDKVKIIFNNAGGMHDFHIDEFNVATPVIQGGKSATVEFTADKTGSFQYYCGVGNHRAMGMWGTLIVK